MKKTFPGIDWPTTRGGGPTTSGEGGPTTKGDPTPVKFREFPIYFLARNPTPSHILKLPDSSSRQWRGNAGAHLEFSAILVKLVLTVGNRGLPESPVCSFLCESSSTWAATSCFISHFLSNLRTYRIDYSVSDPHLLLCGSGFWSLLISNWIQIRGGRTQKGQVKIKNYIITV